ncbi:MAG TPA: 2Fe-2S iron-sulfur cluster-binding protein [Steroidobacteraceae bacterium]|nr:2Fe-2S iron-sulfur cluster-binding protein [Steroidobacteraceae bacterium]
MRISVPKSNISFSAAPDQSLLDAALAASLNLPHSCKGGNCGSCRARLLQGEVYYPNGPPLGLSDAEAAEGFVLLCQARARSDLSIETQEITTPDEVRIKRVPARIERAVHLSHDVMGLYLKLPVAEPLGFAAGQYVDIMLPGGRRRSFSIASSPQDAHLLELHVRRVAGGEFSAPLFDKDAQNLLLTLEGPLGQFVYRPSAAPMLMVGGGTGLAPLLSILRHVMENGIERNMTLYWGVRAEPDLYARALLEEFARRAGGPAVVCRTHFRYVPVLSEPSADWPGSRGLVHEAVLRDIDDLEKYDVYAAGPPAMIAAARREFGARGVAANRLFFDSFDYAPDSVLRQRTSAATKS